VLITQMDVLRTLLGTTQLTLTQWALALAPAVGLFFLWELGKLVARGAAGGSQKASADGVVA
jgi:P-type Ca2+ transporter type 2C